ncbi:hypothetical protein L6452_43906 [Arctium lappa]|uniref:Uncharacterized protein n=1 Tax=Arctium lappa TaxID=4217 RepID=A0ACB8XEB9_ARCLA|nr:hypothetical protein L6452_43906 [Arctium lappa]
MLFNSHVRFLTLNPNPSLPSFSMARSSLLILQETTWFLALEGTLTLLAKSCRIESTMITSTDFTSGLSLLPPVPDSKLDNDSVSVKPWTVKIIVVKG